MNERLAIPTPPIAPPTRKLYQKPVMETVKLRVKDDVMAVCKTPSSSSPVAGTCTTTLPCFS